MRISALWIGIVVIVFGVLVLVIPQLLNWLVGILLIVIGLFAIIRRG